ncbi:MAG: hypothetical protein HFE84_08390 [Lachnospiraceae bacterium]|nr:hypothetical protein [Lachnospiraceae bacterium]
MKVRKMVLLTAMTAAFGSANLFAAFADEVDVESLKAGWEEQGGNWMYYENGNLVRDRLIWAEGGDGRGNAVAYYVDESGVLVSNTTKTIDGKSYTFGDDGSWIAPYIGATKGKVSGNSFANTWSNIKIPVFVGSVESDYEAEDMFSDTSYASIGNPKVTHDFYLTTNDSGDLQIFYADMSVKPSMDANAFAAELGNLSKGKDGQVSEVSAATVGGQNYAKVSIMKTNKRGKVRQTDYYCRKQDSFMVVICVEGSASDIADMNNNYINAITTAQ